MHSPSRPKAVKANRDINPADQLVSAYPDLACLLRNAAISSVFARHEEQAIRWKRFYTFFGRLSLIAVLLAMISFDYQITLKGLYGAPRILAAVAAAFAATGLLSQAILALSSAKDRWLAARFAAERLRCLKFQLFSLVGDASDAKNLATHVKLRTNEMLASLEQELLGGSTAILEFSPFDVLPLQKKTVIRNGEAKFMQEAAAVYEVIRFTVESQHFEEKFRDHERGSKFPSLLSEFSFMAGAMLAGVGILTALLHSNNGLLHLLTTRGGMEWVDFLTWFLFVLSAVVAIYERGSGHQPNAERYVAYGREIRRIRGGATAHMPESFMIAVQEMEHLMLREIQDFCRDVKHSNYIF